HDRVASTDQLDLQRVGVDRLAEGWTEVVIDVVERTGDRIDERRLEKLSSHDPNIVAPGPTRATNPTRLRQKHLQLGAADLRQHALILPEDRVGERAFRGL